MKYYHSSVRPTEKFNMISSINGTFFDIPTEIRVTDIYLENEKLHIDCTLILNYYDERLQIRELKQNMKMPPEYRLWSPALYIDGKFLNDYNSFLDPVNGYVSIIYKIKYTKINCIHLTWRYPFERHTCSISIETENDEHLSIKIDRDMRFSSNDLSYITREWPILLIDVTIKSYWQSTIATIYLPSILLFSICLFAQFKRRKVQVQILTSAIICIIFLHSTKYISNSFRSILTMDDLWLLGTFIHLISLLSIDLLLPSQHIFYDIDSEDDKMITQNSFDVTTKKYSIINSNGGSKVKFHDQLKGKDDRNNCRDRKNIHYENSILRVGNNSMVRESQRSSYDNVNKIESKPNNNSCYHNFSYEDSPSTIKNKFHLEAYPLIMANNSLTTYQGKEGNASSNLPLSVGRRQMMTDIKGHSSVIKIDDTNKKKGKRKITNIVDEPNKYSNSTIKYRTHPQTTPPKLFSILYTLSEKKKFGVFIVLCLYIIFAFIYSLIVIGILQ